MGHKHTKEDLLAGAMATAFADGLSQVTFGRVAKRLGISDRTIVYYFPTKGDLIAEIIISMGAQLQESLSDAFASPAALLRVVAGIDITMVRWALGNGIMVSIRPTISDRMIGRRREARSLFIGRNLGRACRKYQHHLANFTE